MTAVRTQIRRIQHRILEWSAGPVNGRVVVIDGYIWIGHDIKPYPHNEPVPGSLMSLTNFLDVMRSRKAEDISTPIMEARNSCELMPLANASSRLGRILNFDPETQQVIGDGEANRLLRVTWRGYGRHFYIPEDV